MDLTLRGRVPGTQEALSEYTRVDERITQGAGGAMGTRGLSFWLCLA